jgi:translocator protein
MKNFFKLVIAIAICQAVGIVGSFFTVSAIPNWYSTLVKPALNPPSWVFGPVWTTLYALMGIAAFLVWSSYAKASEDKKRGIKIALGIFGIQLFLNAIWSIIFFGLNSPGWALIDIVFLWLAIVWTIAVFYKISPHSSSWRTTEGHGKLAAYLLVPYLLWVSFATYLNYAIWTLN